MIIRSILALALLVSIADAQERPWQIVTYAGDTLSGCYLTEVREDEVFLAGCPTASVMIDSIDVLYRPGGTRFWTGAVIGTLAGAVTGGVTMQLLVPARSSGCVTQSADAGDILTGVVIGAAGGAVIGGVIGSLYEGTEEMDLAGRSHRERVMILRTLFANAGE